MPQALFQDGSSGVPVEYGQECGIMQKMRVGYSRSVGIQIFSNHATPVCQSPTDLGFRTVRS